MKNFKIITSVLILSCFYSVSGLPVKESSSSSTERAKEGDDSPTHNLGNTFLVINMFRNKKIYFFRKHHRIRKISEGGGGITRIRSRV